MTPADPAAVHRRFLALVARARERAEREEAERLARLRAVTPRRLEWRRMKIGGGRKTR